MKSFGKFLKFLLICALIAGAIYGIRKYKDKIDHDKYVQEVTSGWYVEILQDYLKVHDNCDLYDSTVIGKVYKGEVFKVLEVNTDDPDRYWFKISYNNGIGWVVQNTSGTYLKDVNDTNDYAVPIIKFDSDTYNVISINDINTKNLTLWDDRDDYKVTYVIYHEVNEEKDINQYWINWTITDASGKSSSKMQKIVFENKPSEDLVKDFATFERD